MAGLESTIALAEVREMEFNSNRDLVLESISTIFMRTFWSHKYKAFEPTMMLLNIFPKEVI